MNKPDKKTMDTKTVLMFVFNGMADWEPAYATVGISLSGRYRLQTVGMTQEPVRTMGGLTLAPDLTTKEADLSKTALLILPGGTGWEEKGTEDGIKPLLGHCLANDIPVAAICAATTFLAREGWLDHLKHTSNHPEYLKTEAPEYTGASRYKIKPAVADRDIITASGTSPIAFAKEIFAMLEISEDKELKEWFGWFEKFNTETVGLE